MKKLLTLLMAAALLLTCIGSASAIDKIVDEPITIRVMQYALENQQSDFENMWYFDVLEDGTNIKVEWEVVRDADWETKTNLMFASGDYPDVIIRGVIDVEEYGVNQGILIPIEDYLEEYMPNYYSRLSMNNVNASIPASDGHSYYVGWVEAQNINHESNTFINQKWLDNLGLEIPTTIEELNEVLIAFRDQDANGNGDPDDEIPFSAADLTHQTQGVYTHFANFGVPLTKFIAAYIDDDKDVYFVGDAEGFRACCEWLNWCYTEGLLDPEAMTQDSNNWNVKVNADRVGYTTYLRTIATAWQDGIKENYVSIVPPASEYGVKVSRILELPDEGAYLTIAAEEHGYVEEILQWLDAQLEQDMMFISRYGPLEAEGAPMEPIWEYDDEGKLNVFGEITDALYQYVPMIQGQYFAPGEFIFEKFNMPAHRVERYEQSVQYEEAGVLETYSFHYLYKLMPAYMTPDEALTVSRLFTELDTFLQESITSFIINGVTDDSWNTFVETAKAIGSEEYVELYQKAFDAYCEANGL